MLIFCLYSELIISCRFVTRLIPGDKRGFKGSSFVISNILRLVPTDLSPINFILSIIYCALFFLKLLFYIPILPNLPVFMCDNEVDENGFYFCVKNFYVSWKSLRKSFLLVNCNYSGFNVSFPLFLSIGSVKDSLTLFGTSL